MQHDSTGRSVSSFCNTAEGKQEQKKNAKNEERKMRLGEEKQQKKKHDKNKFILCKIPTKKVPLLAYWPAKHSHTSWRRKKNKTKNNNNKTKKKDSHQKDTSVLYISTNHFDWSLQRNNSIKISQLSPFILNGTFTDF